MNRLELLERIADFAIAVRSLERELARAKNPRLTLDRLNLARAMLDEAVEELKQNERRWPMTTWTQTGDTQTATLNRYRVTVSKSEQFGSYGYIISNGHHIVRAGDKRDLEAAKLRAEQEATELEQV